ncbi:MAG TPA: glycosyltransferase [Patescibacteria group bacterium]|nr:glycosyltransferase [Patescibacteria group bacterium]
MRVLFLHRSFPAQFRYLAAQLALQPMNQVAFLTNREGGILPGVNKILYTPSRSANPDTQSHLNAAEGAVLHGQAAYREMAKLKAEGFVPDVICGHSYWGPTLFAKDLFPHVPLLAYFEWFYKAEESDSEQVKMAVRTKNVPILWDLASCDQGLTPTTWQGSRFPTEYRDKIQVIRDGVDHSFFCPRPGHRLLLPRIGLDLSDVDEVVTYVSRSLEPLRGFPQFMQAAALIQKARPRCHVVVTGMEQSVYERAPAEGKTYKQILLETVELDRSRIHFTGWLSLPEYREVLQASTLHVYLTKPYILSWSLLEALACGCLTVASDSEPVREVIRDGENGLLVDMNAPGEIAAAVADVLSRKTEFGFIREKARQTICENYDLDQQTGRQIELLRAMAARSAQKR